MSFFKGTNTITPWINVLADFNVDPTGTNDCAAGVNSAISLANSNGYNIYFPPGTYKIGSPLAEITKNGVIVKGAGRNNTIIAPSFASGNVFTVRSYYMSMKDFSVEASVFRTSGNDILLYLSSFSMLEDLSFVSSYTPISIIDSTETVLSNINIKHVTGPEALVFADRSTGAFSSSWKNILGENPYPQTPKISNLKNFVGSTSYSSGDIFLSNGWIWQVNSAGTTASTGPNKPSTNNWYSTNVTNGTAQLRAVADQNLCWLLMDNKDNNGPNSLTILNANFVGGNVGIHMIKSNTAIPPFISYTSPPRWIFAQSVVIEQCYTHGVLLNESYGFHATDCNIMQTLTSDGIRVNSQQRGEVLLNSCRITESGKNGIFLDAGKDFKIDGCVIANNGLLSSNTDVSLPLRVTTIAFSDANVAGVSNGFTIVNNSFGWQLAHGYTSRSQVYTANAITISSSSSNNFVITGNMSRGNRNGFISNAATPNAFKIVANNSIG